MIQKMDNQQPSSEKEKVQRLSHKGVLNDKESLIIWETPPNNNKVYVYTLSSTDSKIPRYVGITVNPVTRLSHHITYKDKNPHKYHWIKKVLKSGELIVMTVIEEFDDVEKAREREEELINSLVDLTNIELKPTCPKIKTTYLYNLETEEVTKFISRKSACLSINSSNSYNNKLKGKYLISCQNDFYQRIQSKASIKLYNGIEIKYAVSYQHAAWIVGCSVNMINLCLLKQRKSAKGWNIYFADEDIDEYKIGLWKKVKCINDGKIFTSVNACADYYSIDPSGISKTCKGKRSHCQGLTFNYCE